MGNYLSRWWRGEDPEVPIDGLGLFGGIERDFDAAAAREKLEQLLRASINSYRLSSIAQPLVAAYFLGASPQTLSKLYEQWVPILCAPWPEDDPVADSIGKFNLDEFYGEQSYEQRYFDYFRDCQTEVPNWTDIVNDHLGELSARLIRNDYRPLIELSSALESDNAMIACEALAMACTDPEGSVGAISAPDPSQEHPIYLMARSAARLALDSGDYHTVVVTQAHCELFLSEKIKGFTLDSKIRFLHTLHGFIRSRPGPKRKMPEVTAEEALASGDPELVTYTRSRRVLGQISV